MGSNTALKLPGLDKNPEHKINEFDRQI